MPRGIFGAAFLRAEPQQVDEFVTLPHAQGMSAQRTVPRERKQAAFGARAQTIGAFPAHARECGGPGDASRVRKRVEEAKLTLGSPAVGSQSGCGDCFAGGPQPAWITSARL